MGVRRGCPMELAFMLVALTGLQALILREHGRWGWGRVAAGAAAWSSMAVIGYVRTVIGGLPLGETVLGVGLLYVTVCIVTLGRPMLIMTEFFEDGELMPGERRRGHLAAAVTILAVGVFVAFHSS